MLVDTNDAKFHVGEKWSYCTRPGDESSTFTVVMVESNDKLGVIVHISVEGLRTLGVVAHMPFAEAAIEKSVTTLVAKSAPLPDFDDGYRAWRAAFDSGKGGVFSITVGEGIVFVEKTLMRGT